MGIVNATLKVNGTVTASQIDIDGFSKNALVPKGAILMWSGGIDQIPAGWVLCDGQTTCDGTPSPDLRDRFIVGSGGTYGEGERGGKAGLVLSTDQMPRHTHPIEQGQGGEHTHTIYTDQTADVQRGANFEFEVDASDTNKSVIRGTHKALWGGHHYHDMEVGESGAGAQIDIRPPYFAIAFIMRCGGPR